MRARLFMHSAYGIVVLVLTGACTASVGDGSDSPAGDSPACTGPGCEPIADSGPSDGSEKTGQADGSSDSGAGRDGGRSATDAGPRPPPDAGSGNNPTLDRVNCYGPASSSGTVLSSTPTVTTGTVLTDPSSGIRLVLLPRATIAAGDLSVAVYFTPYVGQSSYPPNGSVGCAILRSTGGGWSVVDRTQLCEVTLAQLTYATAPSVCDGTIGGVYRGVFAGNATLSGSFVLPLNIAASQVRTPSCRPRDGICSKDSDCCSGSCSRFVGVCN
jgi:hypothetical protein